MKKNKPFNVIIAGVGGQGLITITQILAETALLEGYDVKTSELHGLAQRGGSVETHFRFGKEIYSPLIDDGEADLIISLEIQEGLRKITFSNSKTNFVINNTYITYPGGLSELEVRKKAKNLLKKRLHLVSASEICKKELGNEVVGGIYLLGYAVYKKLIPLKEKSVLKAIEKVVPEKYLEINKKAFELIKNHD